MFEAHWTAPHDAPHKSPFTATSERSRRMDRAVILYVRLALGSAFLSAVADRFGVWGKYGGWGNFGNFTKYTAQVNSFMPVSAIPILAWGATVAETLLGIALIVGLWPRWVALVSSLLLAISFGVKSPMDYSVFSASAGALLLALYESRRPEATS